MLRGPPQPGDNLQVAAELEAAAQRDVVAELRERAAIVVRSYAAAGGAPWPAIVVLNEVLQRPEMKR